MMTSVSESPKSIVGGERRRRYVHLGLLIGLAGALLSLTYLSHSITIHVVLGVLFMAFLVAHLYQRRRTVRSLAKRLITRGRSKSRRVAISDTILEFLGVNVLVSGIVDRLHHQATYLPLLQNLGLPPGLTRWHQLSSIILVIYVIVHVSRRKKRLRRSHIQ